MSAKRAAIAFLVLAQAAVLKAQTVPQQRATLKGLKSFYVAVETINPEAERAGLSRDQMKTDVELRLRKAGVRVADMNSSVLEYLYVNVAVVRLSTTSGWVYNVEIDLHQPVTLLRNKSVAMAPTWSSPGDIGFAHDFTTIRGYLGDQVDAFINDYLAANP